MTAALYDTLLQATHLGQKEKRKQNTDTGTVSERICGALCMNGVEPIHDGKPELASRILTLRADMQFIRSDSPRRPEDLLKLVVECRDAFWSESVRMCAGALALDAVHGERLGKEIEEIFGATRIGRLSAYLRMMYLAWAAALPAEAQARALEAVAGVWRKAFTTIAKGSLRSLVAEELTVTALRYVFAYGASVAEKDPDEPEFRKALGGKFVQDPTRGIEIVGPLRAAHLARLAREAGKALNAPDTVTRLLRAEMLRERLLDGLEYLHAAGFVVEVQETNKGNLRWAFSRELTASVPKDKAPAWDSWHPQ